MYCWWRNCGSVRLLDGQTPLGTEKSYDHPDAKTDSQGLCKNQPQFFHWNNKEMVQVDQLTEYTAQFLNVRQFRDYAPNGLQVAGRPQISKVVAGVSANRALIEAAIAEGADALVVHHGFFWKGEDPCLTGWRRERIRLLLQHDLNLFAYHLPLDAHPEVGNNAQLAQRMGWQITAQTGEQGLLNLGSGPHSTLAELGAALALQLQREPLLLGDPQQPLRRLAWCTGGAQGYFEEAILAGADVFITGEVSERMADMARESGVAFVSAGHYATEQYGVQALAAHWAAQFGVSYHFVPVPNPV